ncbi:CidA/LrgA family protein [Avibacterium avium]|uniref:CidA/LrgA family protein n=2 Tax=Avibacterium avium TaxID=751 RepID=UPI003BF7DB86
MLKLFYFLRSVAILYLMLLLGELIISVLPLGIPASIWGLVLLFLCLSLQIIKVDWILQGSRLINRYMAVLFVPISVGIMEYSELLFSKAKVLLIPNIIATFLTLILVGLLSDYLFAQRSFRKLRQRVLKQRGRGKQ